MIWLGLLTNKWVLGALGAVVVVGAVWLSIHNYGVGRYNEGVAVERAAWQETLNQAVEARNRANAELQAKSEELALAIRQRDAARAQALTQVQEEITNAPDFEGRYSAYLVERNRLRNETTERHARARADYLPSEPSNPSRGPRGVGSELRVSLAGRGSTLCLAP